MFNKDYKDIVLELLKHKVRFLTIGAYAMAAHGYPRATGDFDLWVEASEKNSKKIYQALKDFGAPVKQIKEEAFAQKGMIFQIGLIPRRIDIITDIDGVDFSAAYKRKKRIKVDGINIPFISIADLIENKQATGRQKDKLDAENLKKHI